jgi:hypothetical protein
MTAFYMKKWYFDFATDRGETFYAYFITYRIFGKSQGLVSAHLTLPDGNLMQDSITTEYSSPNDEGKLALGPHFLIQQNGRAKIHIELSHFAIDLQYLSQDKAWIPAKDGLLLKKKRGFLKWHVPQPSARVEGTIKNTFQVLKINGFGYQDIVETNIPPWRLPLAELIWGRAHCGGRTVIFNQITTKKRNVIQNIHLSAGADADRPSQPEDAASESEDNQRYALQTNNGDEETRIAKGSWTLLLKRRSIIEESPVTTSDRIRSSFLRNALARIAGDPQEKKMFSEARLSDGEKIWDGVAIHERVLWQWKTR